MSTIASTRNPSTSIGAPLDMRCGGFGILYCYCGGDFCVCANRGEIECPGCPDCEGIHDWEEATDADDSDEEVSDGP